MALKADADTAALAGARSLAIGDRYIHGPLTPASPTNLCTTSSPRGRPGGPLLSSGPQGALLLLIGPTSRSETGAEGHRALLCGDLELPRGYLYGLLLTQHSSPDPGSRPPHPGEVG